MNAKWFLLSVMLSLATTCESKAEEHTRPCPCHYTVGSEGWVTIEGDDEYIRNFVFALQGAIWPKWRQESRPAVKDALVKQVSKMIGPLRVKIVGDEMTYHFQKAISKCWIVEMHET